MARTTVYKELDEVYAPEALPEIEVHSGDRGVVVEVFDHPTRAVMVEYADSEGQTKATVLYSLNLEHVFEVVPERSS
jgi:hypothetical protein